MKKIILFLLTTLALFGAESILEQVDKKLSPSSADSYKKLINICLLYTSPSPRD